MNWLFSMSHTLTQQCYSLKFHFFTPSSSKGLKSLHNYVSVLCYSLSETGGISSCPLWEGRGMEGRGMENRGDGGCRPPKILDSGTEPPKYLQVWCQHGNKNWRGVHTSYVCTVELHIDCALDCNYWVYLHFSSTNIVCEHRSRLIINEVAYITPVC